MVTRDAHLPHPSNLPAASEQELDSVLTRLFEHAPSLQSLARPLLRSRISTYDSLIDSLRAKLKAFVPNAAAITDPENAGHVQTLDDILNAHPRLGENKANLSTASASEQANLQSSPDQAESEQLARLNAEYERRFHLRYLVFVNGRRRPEIFVDMRRRIDRDDPWLERIEAVDALCDIAKDRVGNIGVADASDK